MDLGPDPRKQPIGEKGEAYFSGIPASFRGQEVPVWVESEKFESVGADQKYRLDGSSLYVAVRKKSGKISGHVQDSDGNSLGGAEIHVVGLSTTTDKSGDFGLIIPGDHLEDDLELEAAASGYEAKRYKVVANSNPVTISLSRKR
jgi:hypothetical protein